MDKKHVPLLFLGFITYIMSIVKIFSHGPSTKACLGRSHAGAVFMTAVTCIVLLSIFVFTMDQLSHPIFCLICVVLTLLTLGLGIHYYIDCFNTNSDINEILADSVAIRSIQSQYEKKIGKMLPISNCLSYHNGSYYDSRNIKCVVLEGCPASTSKICNPEKGAKLVDFYIASSHNSCHVPDTQGNYVSSEMLKAVLFSGARFVDFDIYAHVDKTSDTIFPVVKSTWKNKPSENFVHIDDIWKTINNYAFLQKNADPLLIHLNLCTNNIEVIDKIATSYTAYMNGNFILDPRYSYHSKSRLL